jgi:hypothetical protein
MFSKSVKGELIVLDGATAEPVESTRQSDALQV